VVSPVEDDHQALQTIFGRLKWSRHGVPTLAKARAWIGQFGPPAVIICERQLSDGLWKQLFEETEALPQPPKFIVASRQADEYLWAEVLNMGGHDVLSIPFEQAEVSRVVLYASEFWHRQWGNRGLSRRAASSGGGAVSSVPMGPAS